MKLIVGLGNPGIEYQFTPHNMGFLAVDRIAEECGARVTNRHCRALTARTTFGGHEVVLAKPETYMNLSGVSVRELVAEYAVDVAQDLVVIYDELDLPFGSLKVRPKGSAAGHNGIKSILSALGTEEFIRVRLGIAPEHKISSGAQYVLAPFRKAQQATVVEVLDKAKEAVEVILREGVGPAMNRFNRREKDGDEANGEGQKK